MLTKLNLQEFLQELGSEKPAPGGGSASALAGALAGALVKMVAGLSGDAQVSILAQAETLVQGLSELISQDTEAFNQVMASFKLPRKNDEEKRARTAAIQKATKVATEVPLRIMEVSLDTLVLAKEMAFKGNPNAISDAGVAALFAMAACKGASYNVLINLPGLKDQAFVDAVKERVAEILQDALELETCITEHVMEALN